MQDHSAPHPLLSSLAVPRFMTLLVWICRHFLESMWLISQLMLVLCNPESTVRSLPPRYPLFFLPFSSFLKIYGDLPFGLYQILYLSTLYVVLFGFQSQSSMYLSWLVVSSKGAYNHKILRVRIFFEIRYACWLLLLLSVFQFFFSVL